MNPFYLACFVAATSGQGLGNPDEAPKWAADLEKRFVVEKLVESYPDDGWLTWRRPPSRYELAVVANAVLTMAERHRHEWQRDRERLSTTEPGPEASQLAVSLAQHRTWLLQANKRQKEIARLVVEFKHELEDLGVSVPAATLTVRRIPSWAGNLRIPAPGEALRPFGDVPSGHWAGPATANLRREGGVTGTPDGKFRG